jgi:3-oxoacyl-[acyl-carrier protein] reductase
MAYASVKAALLACASARSQALAADGIRVNSVSPGPVQFAGGVWDAIEAAYPDLYASTLARIPVGRMGQADELARLIAFTASPACRYMTGANIVADGGLTRRVAY